jgi:hypothetical protein
MTTCPSDFALEESLLDDDSEAGRHVATCPLCAQRLGEMEVQRQHFRRVVRPHTIDAILARAPTTRPAASWKVWMASLASVSALAAVLIVMTPGAETRPVPTEHAKGGPSSQPASPAPSPFVLSVFAGSHGVVHPVADGDEIPAGAELRFRVGTPHACWLTIASLDDKGAVSHLYPAGAPAFSVPGGNAELQGGALLDGVPGAERLFAVCTPAPVAPEELSRAIQSSVTPSSMAHAAPPLALPDGTVQSTLLLRKGP